MRSTDWLLMITIAAFLAAMCFLVAYWDVLVR